MTVKKNYLAYEESQMYDRDPKVPLQPTSNAALIQYALRGLTHMEGRRCTLSRISKTTALVEFATDHPVPDQVFLSIPDAQVEKVGCVKINEVRTRMSGNKTTVTLRFIRHLTQRELDAILSYSLLQMGRPGASPTVTVRSAV